MKVFGGYAAGCTGDTDRLPGNYGLIVCNQDFAQVRIAGRKTIMLNCNVITRGATGTRHTNASLRDGEYRIVMPAKVGSAMQAVFTGQRMDAIPKSRGDFQVFKRKTN